MRMFKSRVLLFFTALFFLVSTSLPIYGAISRNELVAPPDLLKTTKEQNLSGEEVLFQSRNPQYTTYFLDSGLILAGFTERSEALEYFEIQLQLQNIGEDVEVTTL